MTLVEDIIRDVVAAASIRLNRPAPKGIGKEIFFMDGTTEEVEARLVEITKAAAEGIEIGGKLPKKYPLVILFHDFPIRHTDRDTAIIPKLVIATLTQDFIHSPARRERNFRPVIYPIYQELLTQFRLHKNTQFPYEGPVHTHTDRYFWGTTKAGTDLDDYLDAKEISNLEIGLVENNCTSLLKN